MHAHAETESQTVHPKTQDHEANNHHINNATPLLIAEVVAIERDARLANVCGRRRCLVEQPDAVAWRELYQVVDEEGHVENVLRVCAQTSISPRKVFVCCAFTAAANKRPMPRREPRVCNGRSAI